MNISKSRYVTYCQCPKKLWLDTNHPELADALDQTVFKNGTIVGELAQGLFPGGSLVEFNPEDPNNIAHMIKKTQDLMDDGVETIYEAAFSKNGLLAICDIIIKVDSKLGMLKKNRYDIYEVKSSTALKEVYIQDVAFQQYVLSLCDVSVRDTYIVHINNQYERHGALNIDSLFTTERVTEFSKAMQAEISEILPEVFELLEMKKEYQCDIGIHCSDPYQCQFETYCWGHIPPISVFKVGNLRSTKKFDCYYNGIITFDDLIMNNIGLSTSQRIQIDSELNDIETVNINAIRRFLSSLSYPLYFLDFETFMSSIPLYDGTRPYQQIPSQYSLHYISHEYGQLEHKELLAKEGIDPRLDIAMRLIEDIPMNACVLAYNMSFEKRVIRELADQFQKSRKGLLTIHDNIIDLMEPFRSKSYYKKEMQGSYSIKYVLPALFPDNPELSYGNLGIVHNGSEAMNAYATLMELPEEERLVIRESLLEYCKLDTLAMVKIWEKLKSIAK